ncbi:hypothetical protein EST38_g11884 [Candolleomyces aberdarensis]|uniref:Uncharacterized protein n=1 Tax=Candolleomyces aberdarensis TaxID=2316362 RepID=A0A4Q2D742_9AGAR|nr:hypothetical protein EST38_g11884 [Candolleomyces aberdarensis]
MAGLTSLTVAMPAPVRMDDLVILNGLPQLKTLSLSTHGPAYNAVYPKPGRHLTKIHPDQGKSQLKRLTLEGDPFFIFWATSFFCSPSLHTFVGIVSSKLYPEQFPGLLLMPHILHLVIHSNPKVQEFSIEWKGRFRGDEAWDWHDQRLTVPEDLGKALRELRHLEKLSIKQIPIITTDFIVKVLDALPHLPSLDTLYLVPKAADQDDILELPPMEDLASIRERFPALRHLTLSMDTASDIPSDLPEIVYPGHPLETLFIVPPFGELERELTVSELIPLSAYLDRLFPNLEDITSYFEPSPNSQSNGESMDEGSVTWEAWTNLDGLLKSYQQIRDQAVHHLQQNAQAPAGEDTVDMDHE